MTHVLITYLLVVLTICSYFAGFLLPYIIRILTKNLADDDEKMVMTFLICFVAAMLIDYKDLNSGNLPSIVLWFSGIFTESQAMFKLYLKPKWTNQVTTQPSLIPEEQV